MIEDLDKAIVRCQHFLEGKELAHDEFWMAKQASLKLGGEVAEWGNALLLTQSPMGDDMRIFVNSAELPVVRPPYISLPVHTQARQLASPFQDFGVLKVMSLAFQCIEDEDSCVLNELLEHISRPGFGYGVTHQLWALVGVYNLGLIPEDTYLKYAPSLAQLIYEEMIARLDYSDITFERMAFLCYAGLEDWIPEKFYQFAIASQNADGSWPRVKKVSLLGAKEIDKSELISLEHTVSLAFYAFAGLRGKCAGDLGN